jgi:hypothetical protein
MIKTEGGSPCPGLEVSLDGGKAPPGGKEGGTEGGKEGGTEGGRDGETDSLQKANALTGLGSGRLGKICIHKSGRMVLHAGGWEGREGRGEGGGEEGWGKKGAQTDTWKESSPEIFV